MAVSLSDVNITTASRSHCYKLDPTQDPRWAQLLEQHPKASVFHTAGWLKALRRTYGYDPVAFTTSAPSGELSNGLVFCRIQSWLTGHRLVSLPFSDHCEPLCDHVEDLNFLVRYLRTAMEHEQLKYLEVRPANGSFARTNDTRGFLASATYHLHILDLRPGLDEMFSSFDKDSVQRRIHRAERAGLVERCGNSEPLLKEFYNLFILTRGRHRVPPTPYSWFRNLSECLGKALEVRVAYNGRAPIAAIVILTFKDVAYYKYGGSDAAFNNLGGMPWLLWNAIVAAKKSGATRLDLGRTDEDNPGLLAFKNHWVPEPHRLVYWKYPESASSHSFVGWKLRAAKRVFSFMPDKLLRLAGRLMYRHIG
jgi:hypothetical protein